jgi:uncharacterized protein with ParB-like and HNH nuclease domain
MKNIDAVKKELKDLLSREFFYRVPEYQRPYSWDEEHFVDLIEDLLDAKKDQEYFLGTIVVHKKEGINDIVDGQQRLTTILILLACLRDLIEDENFKDSVQEKIIQKENVVDGIPQKVRIEVKDREIFNELIIPSGGTNTKRLSEKLPEPQWRYFKAIAVFKEHLGKLNQKALKEFTQFLSQNCIMIFLSTSTFDDAFKLFTIVNDRGKQLRRIDILKANNISPTLIKSEPVRNSLSQKWEEQEKNLGGETFENVLFLMRLILVGEKPQNDLLVEFEEKVFKKGIIEKGEKFVDLVCEYSQLYNDVFEDYNYFDNSPFKHKLIGLMFIMNNEFKSNEWKAPVLLYLKKFKLVDFEKFIFLIEMKFLEGWVSNQSKDSRIVFFGNVIKFINASSTTTEILESSILKYNIASITSGLDGDIYYKSFCRYILSRLELLTTEHDVEKRLKAKSIEHILPQKPNSNSLWNRDFTPEQKELWTDRLANLVLLSKSKNSSAGNLDFQAKKMRYLQTRVTDYPRSIQVLKYDNWTVQVLEKRQQESLNIILSDLFK